MSDDTEGMQQLRQIFGKTRLFSCPVGEPVFAHTPDAVPEDALLTERQIEMLEARMTSYGLTLTRGPEPGRRERFLRKLIGKADVPVRKMTYSQGWAIWQEFKAYEDSEAVKPPW